MKEPDVTALIPPASTSGARRGWRCPDEERLAAYVEGTLEGTLREDLEGHLADCGFCCGQVGFLARAKELGPPPAVPGHLLSMALGERSWMIGRLRPATVVAAGAGLALLLLATRPWERPVPVPDISNSTKPDVSTSAGPTADRLVRTGRGSADTPWIVRPSEGESVSRKSLELEWEEAPGALFYTVQLVDPKGDVVWEGRAEGARLAVPADAGLATGQPYFAWVIAHLRSGATVRSKAVGFRLDPG